MRSRPVGASSSIKLDATRIEDHVCYAGRIATAIAIATTSRAAQIRCVERNRTRRANLGQLTRKTDQQQRCVGHIDANATTAARFTQAQ